MTRRKTIALIPQIIFAACALPQSAATLKKPIAFTGRVDSIDKKLLTVAIIHGNITGYLPAMTTDHPVDRVALLAELNPGDDIAATVYAGDSQTVQSADRPGSAADSKPAR